MMLEKGPVLEIWKEGEGIANPAYDSAVTAFDPKSKFVLEVLLSHHKDERNGSVKNRQLIVKNRQFGLKGLDFTGF